ncbi:MAG TPA: hypothetical protein VFA55_01205 [Candidatus Kapabacteria bacterium]|nr:hypothetical protein [Candidatus Kapabacteria bacterium]
MNYNKEDIKKEYLNLKNHLGHQPSSSEFYKHTKISEYVLERTFGSKPYAKLVKECGDEPQEFSKPKAILEEILAKWGELARITIKEHGGLPVIADWNLHRMHPSAKNINRVHKIKWSDIPYRFLEFAAGKEEWNDVVAYIPARSSEITISDNANEGVIYEVNKFIPPIVRDLVSLSTNEEKALEYERKVNLIFQMLGFEVEDYGQGARRNPDGIAKDIQSGYAILIDAKSRKGSYKIGTEDRKFIEYIKTHSDRLERSGFSKKYFLVVSHKFDPYSEKAISNIKLETSVVPSFLTSRLLLKILAYKIEEPRLFDLKNFQRLLIDGGEITEKKIDKFISKR